MANLVTKIIEKQVQKILDNNRPKPLEYRLNLPFSNTPYSLQNSLEYKDQLDSGAVEYFELDKSANVAKALKSCPPVSYIINKKARAFCSGIISAVYVENNTPVKGFDLQFQQIIDKPNFLQTGYQFMMQNYAQMQGHGYSVCLKVKAGGQLSSVWVLPNELVTIEWEANWTPFKRKDILSAVRKVYFCGQELDKKDIYIFTDSTPCEDNLILPISRLRALKYPINNLIVNYESRGKLMNKPMGILSNNLKDNISAMELDPDDIDKLHADFDMYGLSHNQRRFIITGASLDWKPISFPLSDMQMDIFERNDTITIAEGLDYPPFLLGISEKGIYNNVSEAYKAMYTGSIIPDGANYVQQLDQCFETSTSKVTYKISFKHLAVLQEGLKAQNEARSILVTTATTQFEKNQITYGRLMEILEEANPNSEWVDLYYYQMPYNMATTSINPPTNEAKK